MLFRSIWSVARAQALAARLERLEPPSADSRGRASLAYRLTLGRQPEPDEMAEALAFIDQRPNRLFRSVKTSNSALAHDALVDFCHVLLNSNEFLYVD